MNKEQIRHNLRRAIDIMAGIPQEQVDLESFRNDTACGSTACLAGHLAQREEFQAQGMFLACVIPHEGCNLYWLSNEPTPKNADKQWQLDWLDELFGPDSYGCLFEPYAEGVWDEDEGWVIVDPESQDFQEGSLTHKELALARLRKQLALMA